MKGFAATYLIMVALIICATGETLSMDLTQFQWKNRMLFILAQDGNHPLFKDLQSQVVAQKAEVDDRDLIVFEVPAQGPARMNDSTLDRKEADSIRNHFAITGDEFSLILVGKDGGIKLKRMDQVDLREVFKLIDSMPMRQNEMRQKKQ